MAKPDELLDEFPEKSRKQLEAIWQGLPGPLQTELQGWLPLLPGDVKLWRMLVGMALAQFKIVAGDKHTVAIVGPANAGKSTLYNQLVRTSSDRALVEPGAGHHARKPRGRCWPVQRGGYARRRRGGAGGRK